MNLVDPLGLEPAAGEAGNGNGAEQKKESEPAKKAPDITEQGEEIPAVPPKPSAPQQEVLPEGWTVKNGVYFNENGVPVGEKGLQKPAIDPVDVVAGVGSVAAKPAIQAAKAAGAAAVDAAKVAMSPATVAVVQAGVQRVGDKTAQMVDRAKAAYYGNAEMLNNAYDVADGIKSPMIGGNPAQQLGGVIGFSYDYAKDSW
ncbi:hypothetical protein N1030_16345 [Desulfovibrio mangrovi]|uniref:hypothetical protein n=1 Tax=Desulfovibrio mangrovi TaxID=2976983 RepID=UPI002245FF6D|nr:hypothetical protein [Desulfovibrio mangrovi]UZP67147.1 hypothetical protein N1030_16345 [Desulfovibrio mangrovi]